MSNVSEAAPSFHRRRSRAALAWCLATLAVLQAAFYGALDRWPQIRDPEYGFKLARLRTQLAESPDRPLVLLVGSSRSGVGIDPKKFVAGHPADRSPLVFNFALSGAGPIQHLMLLRQLLDAGIRPERLLVELHPLFLNQSCGALREEARIDVHRLSHVGLETLSDYSENPVRLRHQWWKWRLIPSHSYRHQLLDCLLPRFSAGPSQFAGFRQIDSFGWLPFPNLGKTELMRRALVEHARWEYHDCFPYFAVTREPDHALRTLLSLCRREKIGVTFFMMPEGGEFRSWYPPWARGKVDDYLGRLQREFRFEVHDLTTSMPDGAFADSHHLLPEAVGEFSARFAREVIGAAILHVPTAGDREYLAEGPPPQGVENRR